MQIANLVDTMEVLDEAFKHPHLKVTPRTKKFPDIEKAMEVVNKTLQLTTARTVAAQIKPIIEEKYQSHTFMDGEHEDADSKDEWESAVDDMVEEAIEEYVPFLSADWLGNHTIDCRLHEEDGIDKFCTSLGKEVFKQITYGKPPADVLSEAGIAKTEVEMWLGEHIENNSKKRTEDMSDDGPDDDVAAILNKVKAHVGDDYNIMEIYEELELVIDDDEILANGAGARIGLEPEEVQVLQMVTLEQGDDTVDFLSKALEKADAKPKKKAKKKAAPKKKAKKADDAPDLKPSEGGEIPGMVFMTLKESGGAQDKVMCELVGVSRATYNNWCKGKGERTLEGEHLEALRQEFVNRINDLHFALATLDGSEAVVID